MFTKKQATFCEQECLTEQGVYYWELKGLGTF